MEWTFARRYLLSRKSHSVINIIAVVSVVAVAVPVAAMVVLLSVFNGFEQLVRQTYAAVDADIEVRTVDAQGAQQLHDDSATRAQIEAVEGVEAVSFVVEREALAQYRTNRTTLRLRGVDGAYTEVVPIADHITLGDGQVELGEIDRILLGEGVAYSLGLFSVAGGDDVTLYAIGGGEVGSLLPTGGVRTTTLHACGFFGIDRQNDCDLAIVPLRAAQSLFGAQGRADAALVRVAKGYAPQRVATAIEHALGTDVRATTREEKNSAFYRIMRYEKWGIFLVSLLVLVIASFSIVGTVVMLILEKQGEQTVLRAMGADSGFLRRIFVREGLLISASGGAIGLLLGVAVVVAQQYLHIVKMPAGAFLTDNYPVQLQAVDIAMIFLAFTAVAWAVALFATRIIIKKQ